MWKTQLFYPENQRLLDTFLPEYLELAGQMKSNIKKHKSLNTFQSFDRRIKLSCNIKIDFSDGTGVIRKDTKECYRMMLRISDVWYALERLMGLSKKLVPHQHPDSFTTSKIFVYSPQQIEELGLAPILDAFHELFWREIAPKSSHRKELYKALPYIANTVKNTNQETVKDAINLIKKREPLKLQHILALAYSIRICYVHEGMTAALGSERYDVKKRLYHGLYDAIVLTSFTIGLHYCRARLAQLNTSRQTSPALKAGVLE